MMQLAADQARPVDLRVFPALRPENIQIREGAGTGLSGILIGVGGLALAATLLGGFFVSPRHAMAAYLMGVLFVTGLSLGALFFTMALHLTAAGWSATLRRQLENMVALIPACFALFAVFLVVEYASGGILASWNRPEITREGYFILKKGIYFNDVFVVARVLLYFGVWSYLAIRLRGYSLEQDRTGDKWLTNKARFTSSWGMLAFAFTVAFFAFDWLKALSDYRFFSTMWGVYFFAGCAFAVIPAVTFIFAMLRRGGKLEGAVTEEHFHDLAKLMFGFTVFWTYIAFGQYFLIWYGNIPEETAFYLGRNRGPWATLSFILVVGHFLVPFYILLWRFVRRTPSILAAVCIYLLVMHGLDIYWIIRPSVDVVPPGGTPAAEPLLTFLWLDVAGIIGVIAVYSGLLVRYIAAGPLVPLHDPRLPEALKHRNYV